MSSEQRTLSIRIQNPKPVISVKIFDVWFDDELVTSTTPIAEGSSFDYSHTFDDEGNVVTTPDQVLYFDSEQETEIDHTKGDSYRLNLTTPIGMEL